MTSNNFGINWDDVTFPPINLYNAPKHESEQLSSDEYDPDPISDYEIIERPRMRM